MLDLEKKYYSKTIKYIAGTDEAGRGPIAGPVVAAAVIFPSKYQNNDINDSKKLTAKKREKLFDIIIKNALAHAIIFIAPKEIDSINILEASRLAMEKALHSLNHRYDLVLTDAMKLYHEQCAVIPIIKGDSKSLAIAAASILAKVSRDRYMDKLNELYPQYEFNKHKGYPTTRHLELVKKYGIIKDIYRHSYRPVKDIEFEQLSLL